MAARRGQSGGRRPHPAPLARRARRPPRPRRCGRDATSTRRSPRSSTRSSPTALGRRRLATTRSTGGASGRSTSSASCGRTPTTSACSAPRSTRSRASATMACGARRTCRRTVRSPASLRTSAARWPGSASLKTSASSRHSPHAPGDATSSARWDAASRCSTTCSTATATCSRRSCCSSSARCPGRRGRRKRQELEAACLGALRDKEVYRYLPQEAQGVPRPGARLPRSAKMGEQRDRFVAEHQPLHYGDKPGWLKFGFPLSYNSDALEALAALAAVGEPRRARVRGRDRRRGGCRRRPDAVEAADELQRQDAGGCGDEGSAQQVAHAQVAHGLGPFRRVKARGGYPSYTFQLRFRSALAAEVRRAPMNDRDPQHGHDSAAEDSLGNDSRLRRYDDLRDMIGDPENPDTDRRAQAVPGARRATSRSTRSSSG